MTIEAAVAAGDLGVVGSVECQWLLMLMVGAASTRPAPALMVYDLKHNAAAVMVVVLGVVHVVLFVLVVVGRRLKMRFLSRRPSPKFAIKSATGQSTEGRDWPKSQRQKVQCRVIDYLRSSLQRNKSSKFESQVAVAGVK